MQNLDASADGYVRGEACGVIIIENSQPKNRLYVAFAGSSVNQDGREFSHSSSWSITTELSSEWLYQMQKLQLQKCPVSQLHGTGTALGDPIEMGSIASVCIYITERAFHINIGGREITPWPHRNCCWHRWHIPTCQTLGICSQSGDCTLCCDKSTCP